MLSHASVMRHSIYTNPCTKLRRIFRIIFNSSFHEDNIHLASVKLCRDQFCTIVNADSHPLCSVFNSFSPTYRNPSVLRLPKTKTCRFCKSFFIKLMPGDAVFTIYFYTVNQNVPTMLPEICPIQIRHIGHIWSHM